MREGEIDIAVDLMGPTLDARPGILSHRPAPIQAVYLGYAGSSGAAYIDYLLADRIVIPEAEQSLFREKVIYLPDTFMGTDSKRVICRDITIARQRGIAGVRVRVLLFQQHLQDLSTDFQHMDGAPARHRGSLLWLSNTNDVAKDNLRREAKQRGVNPERIVFARRVALNQDHLARHRLADLFLDTMPLGAHSTVCDALMGGHSGAHLRRCHLRWSRCGECTLSTWACRVHHARCFKLQKSSASTCSRPEYT